ncbi:MAG: alpha/beta fold hydrolase [Acidimicrobiia bacterium]
MTGYLDLNHGLVHWKDYGGSGQPLVMVHGLGGSVANWDVIGHRLAVQGRVAALDLPGFGLSPPGKDWSLETQLEAISDFISRVGHPAVLIGNSLGGLLCEMVASQRPELVSALVLISPATPPRLPDPNINWPMARRLLINSTPGVGPAMARRMVRSLSPRQLIYDSLERITHKTGRVPVHVIESLVDLAEKRSHLPWAADAVPKTGQAIRRLFLRRSRFVAMIRGVKAPTLVVQGVADPIVSRQSVEWLCSLRPDWTLVHMEDTGHTPQIDAPVRFLSVVQPWLETHLKHEMSV